MTLSFTPIYAKYAKMSFESLAQSLVAEEASKVVGVINWRTIRANEEQIGYIFWLAIHPEYRRKGTGEQLMRRVLAILAEQNLPAVLTSAEKSNSPSRSLFAKLGFARTSKAKMRERFGKDSSKLYREMWVMPWEDLFIKEC